MMTRNLTHYGRLQLLLACSFIVGAGSISTTEGLLPAAQAAPHAGRTSHVPKVHRDPFRELKGLETRFFFHEYDRESPERRLQRLEDFIFGCHQTGTNEERLDALKTAIAKRDGDHARQISDLNKQLTKTPAAQGSAPTASAPSSSQQFPVLDTLEWRVLKKTYQKESLDQRLERLETALVGQPRPAISYIDRVDSLKKIVGIDIPASNPFLSMPMPNQVGPTTPVNPRQQRSMVPKGAYPFGSPFAMPQARRGSARERTMEEDFQLRSSQDMATILKYMNQFMDQELGPGFMGTPGFSMPRGYSSPPIIIPIPNQRMPLKEKEQIPAYEDPNSI